MKLERGLPAALLALLFFATLTTWVPARWPVSVVECAAGVLACAVFHRRSNLHPLLFPLAAAALWPLLQLALGATVYGWETWTAAQAWIANLLLFFAALQLDAAHRPRLLRALVYFAFVVALAGTVQSFTSEGKVFWLFPTGYSNFVIGPFISPNHYAAFIELILPIAVAGAVLEPGRRQTFSAIAGFLYASVIASGSRAGALLVTLEVAAVWWIASRAARIPLRVTAFSLAALALSAAVFTAVVGPDYLLSRFRLADPFTGRREMLLSSLRMIQDRPWLGVGLGNWPTVYPAYAVYDDGLLATQADNDWIQWAAEGGIPFVLLLLPLPLFAFRAMRRDPALAGPFFFFLHCLADYPARKPALAALLFVLLAWRGHSRVCRAETTSL